MFAARIGAVVVALTVVVPVGTAIPDLGIHNAVFGQKAVQQAQPCNEDGIVWNGNGNPIIASLVQAAGSQACGQLGMIATLQLVRVSGSDDGSLTVEIILPRIDTGLQVPFRDQDPLDPQGFAHDAIRDASAALAQPWVPLYLNPNEVLNAGVPCTLSDAGLSGIDLPVYGHLETPCGQVSVPNPLCDHACGPVGVLGLMTIQPPRRIAELQSLTLLEVQGFTATGQQVFDQTFRDVALVGNTATEEVASVQGEVFVVRAYVTEADEAAGNAIVSLATVLDRDEPQYNGIIFPNPLPGAGTLDQGAPPPYIAPSDASWVSHRESALRWKCDKYCTFYGYGEGPFEPLSDYSYSVDNPLHTRMHFELPFQLVGDDHHAQARSAYFSDSFSLSPQTDTMYVGVLWWIKGLSIGTWDGCSTACGNVGTDVNTRVAVTEFDAEGKADSNSFTRDAYLDEAYGIQACPERFVPYVEKAENAFGISCLVSVGNGANAYYNWVPVVSVFPVKVDAVHHYSLSTWTNGDIWGNYAPYRESLVNFDVVFGGFIVAL